MDPSDLLDQASECLKHGNSARAESICRAVLSAVALENLGSPLTPNRQIAEAHRILAVACRLHGSHTEALQHSCSAEVMYRELGDDGACSGAIVVQGLVYVDTDNNQAAMERFAEARACAERAGDERRIAQVICNVGNVYLNRGEIVTARDIYLDAAKRARSIGDDPLLAHIIGNLGLVHRHLGEPVAAIRYLEEAIDIESRTGNESGRARHLGNLGSVFQEVGDLQRSVALYEEALGIHRQTGQRHNEATWLHNLGVLHQTLGDLDAALQHYEASEVIFHELGAEMAEARSKARKGGVHLQRSEFEDAVVLLGQSLEVAKRNENETEMAIYRSNLGHAFARSGNFAKAQEHLNAAIPILESHDNRHQIAVVWHYQGSVFSDRRNQDRDVNAAIILIERSLAEFQAIDAKRNVIDSHLALGELFRENGEWEKVAMHVQMAAEMQATLINEETKIQTQRLYYQRQIQDIQRENEKRRIHYLAKDEELQNLIDRLVEKNDLLRQISQRIGQAAEHTRPQGQEQLTHVIDLIDRSLRTDSSGKVIDQLMLDIYENFVRRLQTRVPTITEMELKVATLLHRQMTSANIADVLFLSKRTVEVHRHNLRKKLGLHATEDIYQVLRGV